MKFPSRLKIGSKLTRAKLGRGDMVLLQAMALVERKTIGQVLREAVRERFTREWNSNKKN